VRILIDTPPELRLQLINAGVSQVDAILFTHDHADHVHGIDDIRALSDKSNVPIEIYGPPDSMARLTKRFAYIFDDTIKALPGTSKPEGSAHSVPPGKSFRIGDVDVLVLNALMRTQHPTHLSVSEAVAAAQKVGARQTWLIHLTHRTAHAELEGELPRGIAPAFDGLTVEID